MKRWSLLFMEDNIYLKDLTEEDLRIYEKIKPLLKGISYEKFQNLFRALMEFSKNSAIIGD